MKTSLGFVVLFVGVFVSFSNGYAPATLDLVMLQDTVANNYTCNDGTPAGYYIRAGNASKWVIHLQGGGWCNDEATCAARMQYTPYLMSSLTWTQSYAMSGIFDTSTRYNPDWYDATIVYVPYCTSDEFSGTRPASADTFTYSFYGKYVITGVIEALLQVGLADAQYVLLSGCSAGGGAVIANVDYVATLLPPLEGRVFKGTSDAGWFQEIDPMVAVAYTIPQIIMEGSALWYGIPNQLCMDARPDDHWRCYLGEFVHSYIQTPVLFHQETEDYGQINLMGATYPLDAQETTYVNTWRANVTASLRQVGEPHAVFAPACWWHCISETDTFWSVKIDDERSDADALHQFFWNNVSAVWIDDCEGFSCSTNCPTYDLASSSSMAPSPSINRYFANFIQLIVFVGLVLFIQ